MRLKRNIFWRVMILFTFSIVISSALISFFAIREHREHEKGIYTTQATFLAERAERMILWDDRVALRKMLFAAVRQTSVLEYAFVERQGKPYAHSFQVGVPKGLLNMHGDRVESPIVKEIENRKGGVLYDIAVPIGDDFVILHIGLSRDLVDQNIWKGIMAIGGVSAAMMVLGIFFAVIIAKFTTKEVDRLTRSLQQSGYELELRVEERTSELAAANEELRIEIIDRKRAEEEKKKLEEQLRHAQKMEAIGQLAGGIAHDFNNILTAIMGYGNMLQMKMDEDDPLRTAVDQILGSSQKAAQLTQSLLAFSRQQIIHPEPVRLNEIITSVGKLLLRLIGEDVELRTNLTDKDLTLMADSGQIEQVLMNLATNARDAMPEGGMLTISTELVELDDRFIKTHGYDVKPGVYSVLSVADTGAGMDEDTRKRIFEPFFTTKELGRGTGLGLSIIYGIVRQHNGIVNVYSEPGKGTTFKIYLPIIKADFEEAEKETLPPPRGGTETVLTAEDDEEVRKLIKLVLERFGYKVIQAVDGEDAVAKFNENRDKINIAILDVIMPKKDGKAAYEEMKKLRPELKAIFVSGYSADIIDKKGILEEGINFIPKPVAPNDLLRKVREVLDS